MSDGKKGEQKIREKAYHIWEAEGRPEGRAAEHWHMAKQELGIDEPLLIRREGLLDVGHHRSSLNTHAL